MKLEKHNILKDRYICSLTKQLDIVSNISKMSYYEGFHHYILVNEWGKSEQFLPIRVPGGTVGCIYFNDNNIITKIVVDTNYVVKTYPNNINEVIQKFVGEEIEW